MSALSQPALRQSAVTPVVRKTTRIFGMKVALDPKLLLAGLAVLAALLYWFNSRSGDDAGTPPPATASAHAAYPAVASAAPRARIIARKKPASSDRGVLRVHAVDPTRGDVDPTLHLDLLARMSAPQQLPAGRNLFEFVTAPVAVAETIKAPILLPKPLPVVETTPVIALVQANIPLKYYGYVQSDEQRQSNRGLFLDGDNVRVASEGDVMKGRYRVVQLTSKSARLEDTQIKQGQTLPVVATDAP